MKKDCINFQVLLSCMFQTYMAIVRKSNLQNVSTIVVNQCNVQVEQHKKIGDLHWIDSPSRGLSVSRNLAIANASADVCVISDDDEIFKDNLEQIIQQGYAIYPQADIIIFNNPVRKKNISKKSCKLSKYDLLKVASRQISFKLDKVRGKIEFDKLLGAGTGNGGGEENKFLLDCYKSGLQIYFVPLTISSHVKRPSTWFFGYDANYFYNRGKSTRYIFGFWFACLYGGYFLVAKWKKYNQTISVFQAAKALFSGIWNDELSCNRLVQR